MTGSTDGAKQALDRGLAELAAVACQRQRGIFSLGTLARPDGPGRDRHDGTRRLIGWCNFDEARSKTG
jgi:hypothetical protein